MINFETKHKLGITQGRLTKTKGTKIQDFPIVNWTNEFKAASKLKLDFIELIIEKKFNRLNPLHSSKGRKQIIKIAKKNNINIFFFS